MRRKAQTSEEQGPKVPGYIVTFSDMVTLLLTFFVMLLTLADVQDPELFDKGRDAFIESIRYIGLGPLFGRQEMPQLGSLKTKNYIDNPEETSAKRTIDAKAEELQRIFEKIKNSSTAIPQKIETENANFSVTNIRFLPGKADLNESAKQFLTEFCRDLHHTNDRKAGTLYVFGLAPEEKNEEEQWLLSAIRAEVVAKFLRSNLLTMLSQNNLFRMLGPPPRWSVYSIGTGHGKNWTGMDDPGSQILIAVQQ